MKIEDNKMNMVNYSSQSHHNHLQRYALFHGLGLALDLFLLLVVGLCTLHFLDFDLPTTFFARFLSQNMKVNVVNINNVILISTIFISDPPLRTLLLCATFPTRVSSRCAP